MNRACTVLIIDDSAEDRATYRRFLAQDDQYSFTFLESDTAEEGLALYEQERPDLVLLDYLLPDSDGLQCLTELREVVGIPSPAIFLTGQGSETIAVQAMKAGAEDYLVKGKLTGDQLWRAVRGVLEQTRLRRQLEKQREQQRLVSTIALRIRQSLKLDTILQITATEVRQFLKADRVLLYQFHVTQGGTFVAEAVLPRWTSVLGQQVTDRCLQTKRQTGETAWQRRAIEDIYTAGLSDCYIQVLEQFEVKASVVLPVFVAEQLWGLLIVHQCSGSRQWQDHEILFLDQLAIHLAIAIQHAELQQRLTNLNTILEQKVQERTAQLQASEERLLSILQHMPVMLKATDETGHVVFWNEECERVTGYSIDDMMQHPDPQSLLHVTPLYSQSPLNLCQQTDGNFRDCEADLLTKTGERRTVSWSSLSARFPIPGWKHWTIGVDVTQRKQIEQALSQSEAQNRAIVTAIPDMLIRMSFKGYFLCFTPSSDVADIAPDDEKLGKHLTEVLPPSVAQNHLAALRQVEVTGAPVVYEQQIEVNGICQDEEIRVVPLDDQQVLFMVRNISDRKRAERQLQAELQRTFLLQQITNEIRQSLDPDYIFQTTTLQVGQVFGVSRCLIHTYVDGAAPHLPLVAEYLDDEYESLATWDVPVIGNPHAIAVLQQDRAIATDDVTTDPLLQTVIHLCHAKQVRSMLAVRTSYRGKPNGVLGLHQCDRLRQWTTDEIQLLEAVAAQVGIALAQATLLKQETVRNEELAQKNMALEQAKQEAESANHSKSLFLANMSHELRTPLNAVLGFTQIMANDANLTIQQLENLQIINRSGEHLLSLINDILDLSKIEANRISFVEQSFDLHGLLTSVADMLRSRAAQKGLSFGMEIADPVPQYVVTDLNRLRQILTNLLSNAIKFTDRGGVMLRVTTSEPVPFSAIEPGCSLTFDIEDTGIGIAPADLERIFHAFEQTTSTSRRITDGTGLGLTICRKFAELMGGDIEVSSALGKGSTFSLHLPVKLGTTYLSMPLRSPLPRVIGSAPNQPRYRVLIVDDQAENRLLLQRLLAILDLEIETVTSGESAIAYWETWQPHLILLDLRMPGLSGYDVSREIRQREATLSREQATKIIMLTASAFLQDREKAIAAGCDDFLSKPFQSEVLLDLLQQHLGLQYRYDSTAPFALPPVHSSLTLTADRLALMPPDWIKALYAAAIRCNDETVKQLIQQIPLEHEELIQGLTALSQGFQFDRIMQLAQPQSPTS